MKLREEWLDERYRKDKEETEKRDQEYLEKLKKEVSQMDRKTLEEKLVNKIYYTTSFSEFNIMSFEEEWDYLSNECRFCSIEYIGEHSNCCDNCWEDNKDKTLQELE